MHRWTDTNWFDNNHKTFTFSEILSKMNARTVQFDFIFNILFEHFLVWLLLFSFSTLLSLICTSIAQNEPDSRH